MTMHAGGDENRTADLIRGFRGPGPSWLRHTGGAAKIDRLLVFGATAEELSQCRGGWQEHIRHLQSEHHLVIQRPSPENGNLYRLLA